MLIYNKMSDGIFRYISIAAELSKIRYLDQYLRYKCDEASALSFFRIEIL